MILLRSLFDITESYLIKRLYYNLKIIVENTTISLETLNRIGWDKRIIEMLNINMNKIVIQDKLTKREDILKKNKYINKTL